ncbi:MAG: choice-of-anchor M domain-containing protein [Planctomyces sp.]|nr:choice-of-anchor M domain-containing protein [Planctomyces sp.]
MLKNFRSLVRSFLAKSHLGRNVTRRRSSARRHRQSVSSLERLETRSLLTSSLQTFLTTEHVDINLMHDGTSWSIGPRNSDVFPEVQYANDAALMYAGSPSAINRPASADYNFVGVGAGQSFYVLPQSQDPDLLYLGFAGYGLNNTVDRYNPSIESKGRVSGNARWAKVSLADVRHTNSDGSDGSGVFSLWQTGSFGSVNVFMSSHNDGVSNPNGSGLDATDGISADDALWIVSDGHAHYNFGFSSPGRYEVDVRLSAHFGDDGLTTPNLAGYSQSSSLTLYFSVMSAGEVEFESSSYTVDESAGTASIDVVRVGGSDGRIAVNYSTSNGTASSGSDYTAASGTIEFLDGETRKTISIPMLDDSDTESDETIFLELTAPTPENLNDYLTGVEGDANGLLGSITSTVLTITDNDGNSAPTISEIADRVIVEGYSTGAIPFTVADDLTAAEDLVVTVSTSNPGVIPQENIILGGSGANRTIQLTSVLDQVGSTTITVTVTDANGFQSSESFLTEVSGLPQFIAGLTKDHADLGLAFEDGAWDLHVHVEGEEHAHEEGHEEEHGGIEYSPDEILIQLGPSSAAPAPESPDFSFLGAAGGSTIYVLPSVQNPSLPFLGIATEEIPDGTFVGNEISLRLKSVSGPGFYSLWSTDSFGTPTPYLTSSNGISEADVLLLETGTHSHFDMAFTATGVYAVTFEAFGIIPDGGEGTVVSSGDVTYYFSVNLGLAPVINTTEGELLYTEQSAPRIVDANPALTDADSSNFEGGQLRADIPIHAHPADELIILHQGTGKNQIGVSGDTITLGVTGGGTVILGTWTGGTNGEPLVVSLTSAATPSTTRLLMRRIAFRNLSDDPGSEERSVRFVVADGDGEISDAALRVIAVTPVNDGPVVVTGEGNALYVENTAPVVIDSSVTVADSDSPDFDLGRLTVTITVNRQTTDRLSILVEGDAEGQINVSGNTVLYGGIPIGTFTGGFTTSNPLIVTLNASATPEAVQQLARRIAFHNAGLNATELTRTVSFVVNDGDGKSSTAATRQIEVSVTNDSPVITNGGLSVKYSEDAIPVLIASAATVADPDSPYFNGGTLTVSLIAGATGADQLGIRNQGAGNGRINLDGANVTYGIGGTTVVIGTVSGGQNGSDLVISLNENASVIATRALMRNLTFSIVGNTANSARTVRLSLTDGSGGISNHADRIIEVTGVNDAPVITTSAGNSSYTAGGGATVIDDAITVEDVDSADFAGGFLLISLSTNKQTTDRLTIIAEGNGAGQINLAGTSVLYEGIVIGTYTGGFTSNAPLRILFNNNATPAAAQKLARRIGFFNTSASPSLLTRSIVFSVNDGDGKNSLNAIKQLEVGL